MLEKKRMVDILYIFPNTPEPRNVNIINLIKDEKKVQVVYWKKNHHEIKNSLSEKVTVTPIDVPANDHNPFARLIPMFQYFRRLKKILNETKPKCIHVSKLDSMYLVYRYWKKAKIKPMVIYDISDMHSLTYNTSKNPVRIIIRHILHWMEKKVSCCVHNVVLTSWAFWDEYYKEFYSKKKIIFIPNSPDLKAFLNYQRKKDGQYTVGFIGSVRYPEQIKCLIDIAQKAEIRVLIAGGGVDEKEIRKYSKENKAVSMTGAFDYEREVAGLYAKVDCIFAQYDTSIKNVSLALPNRLYEAAYCGLPLIVSKGTYLAKIISEYGLGVAVKDLDRDDLIRKIMKLKKENPQKFIDNGSRFFNENGFEKNANRLKELYLKIK